ncbi:hypothetical protein FRB99_007499 [Tulasnella sp. 403]|nr:hypothetical protein FRB99_007499 [Tulasnella sp. 403]
MEPSTPAVFNINISGPTGPSDLDQDAFPLSLTTGPVISDNYGSGDPRLVEHPTVRFYVTAPVDLTFTVQVERPQNRVPSHKLGVVWRLLFVIVLFLFGWFAHIAYKDHQEAVHHIRDVVTTQLLAGSSFMAEWVLSGLEYVVDAFGH